ncbi:MAG: fructose-6-phosphate aldolase [Planctomycetota bacterium]|jgi:transaldolase
MKIFADTANVDDLRRLASVGLIDGVTTNPSLVAKEGREYPDVIREICEIVDGPISAEVVTLEASEMIEEGLKLAEIHPNVVIKTPMGSEGLKACRELSKKGHRVNMTLVFSAGQALLTAKAGAYLVSPFIGRLDDLAQDGMQLISDICQIYDNYSFDTQVLVASVRHPMHIVEAARLGAHCVTCPPKAIDQLMKHPMTDKGLAQFMADWENRNKS